MENVNFTRNEMYQDYDAALFFQQDFVNSTFTKKLVNIKETGEQCILVHVRATRSDGLIVETDLWPRNTSTPEDINAVNTALENFIFRVGYWPDPVTGELNVYPPKHLVCTGEKRQFVATAK